MNLERIYQYRFQSVDPARKAIVWRELSEFLWSGPLLQASRVLDPAAGFCEFINHLPAAERWAVDISSSLTDFAHPDVHTVVGDCLQAPLPEAYFEGVFVSNFLEHLGSQEEVAGFLERMYQLLLPGGRIVIMGPNFKYAYREYFDFADHVVVLTESAVAEHLYGAGFEIEAIVPRFMPLSFRSGGYLPVTSRIVRTYLKTPLLWKLLGKQFLLVGHKQ